MGIVNTVFIRHGIPYPVMGIASTPSAITLPPSDERTPSILGFLIATFPHVPAERWRERLRDGKLHDESGQLITAATPYRAGLRLLYYREVDDEPRIPFVEDIVFRNDEILVADKPHFLPVVPGGRYVNECLEQRLRQRLDQGDLVPLHRIDRETAGLVLCSLNPATRGLYHRLFAHGEIEKIYHAASRITDPPAQTTWRVENRLGRGEPRFRMRAVAGDINARSDIRLMEARKDRARFELRPLTGKTHQLRVHLSDLGYPILNDRYYPELQAEREDDFSQPLQLIAHALRFRDPVSGQWLEFESKYTLLS